MMQVSTLYAHLYEKERQTTRKCSPTPLIRCNSHEPSSRVDVTSPRAAILLLDPVASDVEVFEAISPVHRSPEVDSKECTDRLCRLPSQCHGIQLGSPRRANAVSATRLTQSAGNLSSICNASLLKKKEEEAGAMDKKTAKKAKEKLEKEAKAAPSNFMLLSAWYTRGNCDRFVADIRSGDILEFNIKLHHHWAIAVLPKNKAPSLATIELAHLCHEKGGTQRVVRQPLKEYWREGVTARINNSRDVHKPPLPATQVVAMGLKLSVQPYRVWNNSEQMVIFCRYGDGSDGKRTRQLSDAARWSTMSKCVGLWLSLKSSQTTSPSGSPGVLRKRTVSVNF